MTILRTAYVYVRNIFAGQLCESDEGYTFTYDKAYLESENASAVSLTLPLSKEAYSSKTLFSFFDGLLLVACKDCIGNVTIMEEKL